MNMVKTKRISAASIMKSVNLPQVRRADSVIDGLRRMGDVLVPYNFPRAHVDFEEDISDFKRADIDADGYSIILHYNKADYGRYYLETAQILAKHAPFLPFHLVVKLARKILGGHCLSLVEFYQENRKIYCWSVCLTKDGKPVPSPTDRKSLSCEFEGFTYKYMHPSQLNFY
jgi:hypothetical protein